MPKLLVCAFVTAAMALAPSPIAAWNHPEITWLILRTEHFEVHYQPGSEWIAARVAETAEEIYGPVTAFYGFAPRGEIRISVDDTEDESQGSTYYYLNRIDITATHLDFAFRGSMPWLRGVIAHEFAHLISVQRSMKFPRLVPALYVQAVTFEKEKRPDVITGYPNFQMSAPVAGELMPNWFAEGAAQFQCDGLRRDFWDSHRDMLLRTAALSGGLLSLDEMGVFGKNSLESEMVYNQGFSMVRFIAERWSSDTLAALARSLARPYRWTFDGACKAVLGISEKELFALWARDVSDGYGAVEGRLAGKLVEGKRLAGKGFLNLHPTPVALDGALLYLSNGGEDFSTLRLVRRPPRGEEETIARDLQTGPALSPDGKRVCYARSSTRNRYRYERNDLYLMDISCRTCMKERRLTKNLRAASPAWSPDGARIACVVNGGAEGRIAIVDAASGASTVLSGSSPERQYLSLSWGPGGILAARYDGSSRDIVLVDPLTGAEREIVATAADERDPAWLADGSGFLYASDRTGIFNVYCRSLADSVDLRVTNCLGGAFMPRESGSDIVFAGYGPDGFEIRALSEWRRRAAPVDGAEDDDALMEARIAASGAPSVPAAPIGEAGAMQNPPAGGPPKEAGIQYTRPFLFPRILVYEGKLRAGIFIDAGDHHDRQEVTAGAAINADREFDLMLAFTTRQFKPTFGFQLYRNRKYYTVRSLDADDVTRDYVIRYDLWDAYFTCALEFAPPGPLRRNDLALRYNHGEYGLNVQVWELLDRREFRGEGGWNYYIGNEVSLLYNYRAVRREVDADINPRGGRSLEIELTRANNRLFGEKGFEYMFRPNYNDNYFGRYILAYEEMLALPGWSHSLSLKVEGGGIDQSGIDDSIDDFFYLYLGGMDGLRGYSYFSIGGRWTALGRATYRFPLWRNINEQVSHVYLASIYASVFGEAGKAWSDDSLDLAGFKSDVGAELRLKGFTFYSYPLAASFAAAYGLDDARYVDPFRRFEVDYEGNRWKFYGSVLFGF